MQTLRNQEKRGASLWVIDKTRTPMGSRLMRSWLSKPLLNAAAIKRRQNAVYSLFSDNVHRGEIIESLKKIGDIERLIGKAVYGSAGGRDLLSMADYLSEIPELLGNLSAVEKKIRI